MRIIVKIIFVILILNVHAFCSVTDDIIREGATARALALGNTFVAIADDSGAPIFNPAGLAKINKAQIGGMTFKKVYGNFNYVVVNSVFPTKQGAFGVGMVMSSIDDILLTTTATGPTEKGKYESQVIYFSFGANLGGSKKNNILKDIDIGINFKLFNNYFMGTPGRQSKNTNMDLGFKYSPNNWISLGVNKQNILGGTLDWNDGTKELFPSPLLVGAAFKLSEGKHTIAIDADIPSHKVHPVLFHLGAEYLIADLFKLRGGLDEMIDATDDVTRWNLSLGVGLASHGIIIDYAYHPYYGDIENNSHFVSLAYTW